MLYDHARISDHRYRYLNILDSILVQGIDLLMLMGEVSCNLFFDVTGNKIFCFEFFNLKINLLAHQRS